MYDSRFWAAVAIYAIGAVALGTWYRRKLGRDDKFADAYSPDWFESHGQAIGLRPGTATKVMLFSAVLWWPLLLPVGLLWSSRHGNARS